MTVKRSERAWKSQERSKKSSGASGTDKRYARLSKNLIINGDLARVIKEYGLTGRDIHVLVTLLAGMQRDKKRTLKFKSTYELLKLLDWGDSRGAYDAVDAALEKWPAVEVRMDRFYDPKVKQNILQEEAHTDADVARKKRKLRNANKHRQETYKELLTVSYYKNDSLSITAGTKFYRSTASGYFVPAWPDEIHQLRYPTEILLYLLLKSFNGKIKMDIKKLAQKLGLKPRSKNYLEERVKKAIHRICNTTNEWYKFNLNNNGIANITRKDRKQYTNQMDNQDEIISMFGDKY